MSGDSWLTASAVVLQKTQAINNLEMRLMMISSEKMLKHAQGASQTAELSRQMAAELEAIRGQLGDSPSSEEYMQNMAQCESVENEYTVQIEAIRDQMERAEEELNLQQETVETQLEVIRQERDQWKELANKKAEKAGYFNE